MGRWTQALCNACWRNERPNQEPVRMDPPEIERCCMCGALNYDGIYVRKAPGSVPYPRGEVGR